MDPIAPTRLDSNVVAADSGDWAKSTANALGTDYPSLPAPKSQADVDRNLTGQQTVSTVSTPGFHIPGAWADTPTNANQIYADVGNALASVGQGAYNLLPEGLKNAVSSSPTKTASPIQTTTNNAEPNTSAAVVNYAQTAAHQASTAAGAIADAATVAAAVVTDQAKAAYNHALGQSAGAATGAAAMVGESVDKSKLAQSARTTATLPSQDVEGQLPYTHTGGAGALPGDVNEQSVAALPEERDASTEFPNQTVESTVQPSAFSNYTEPLTGAGAAAAATVTARAGVAYNKASEVYSNPSAFIPGIVSAQGGTSMPSQEFEGQQPFEHSNGVGALPGRLQEESVAKLPEERLNPNPLATATSEYAAAKQNTSLASPYKPESPYSATNAGTVSQPSGGLRSKASGKAEDIKDRVLVLPSSDGVPNSQQQMGSIGGTNGADTASGGSSPTKKSGFMDKLKGEVSIITGKLSHNEGKIEKGVRLKSGDRSALNAP